MSHRSIQLFEDLLYGFRLDPPRSKAFSSLGQNALSVTDRRLHAEAPTLSTLAAWTALQFRAGAQLELTGGVDSRLVLALGWAGGERPRHSFTIGVDGEADVDIARTLAARLGFAHQVVRPRIDPRFMEDAQAFVNASGFVCNAAAYGWLPAVFRELGVHNRSQIGGVGGEIAEGFYYSGLDPLMRFGLLLPLWERLRLRQPGSLAIRLYRTADFRERLRQSRKRLADALAKDGEQWRRQLDHLYREYRVVNWALPVLHASGCWYTVLMPLLSLEYVQWADSLPLDQREARRAQRRLIAELDPDAASFPYAAGWNPNPRPAATRGALTRAMRRLKRATDRLLSRPRPASNIVQEAAVALAESDTLRRLIHLTSQRERLNSAAVEGILQHPRRFPYELGALATAAWAEEHSQQLTSSKCRIP